MKKDKQGLYFQGEFKAATYTDAIKELFELKEIPKGFCIDTEHEADGYSVVDLRGVQHIYELSPNEFYDALNNLEDYDFDIVTPSWIREKLKQTGKTQNELARGINTNPQRLSEWLNDKFELLGTTKAAIWYYFHQN